ncbi:MAG TPA: TRAP transporter substrate-binding protein [Acetobacteraceae bacterium]|jgi:C4-dicarboxylate-binding protein DctP|nr:TRAP transporter substrate-binding protein [Acetobacteraceae bacterium]
MDTIVRRIPLGRRNVLASTLAMGATAGLAAPAIAQRARVLRYGSMLPADSIYHRACVMFGDELAKLSSGKLKVEVYPDSQLGTIPEMLSSVQTGSLQMTMAVSAWYSKFMKPLDAFTLPYMVPSAEKLQAALGGALGQRIAGMGEATGFQIIGYWLIGGRHIVNKLRPVNKPADCAGLKIRVINSQVYIQTFRALGATAVAMDPSELYLALQQGVVDGFEYPLPDLISYKFYEVSKYLSLDGHTTDFFLVSINKTLWQGMSAEEQGMMAQAMKTAMEWQWREQPGEIAKSLTKLKTLMQVNELSDADKALFIEATKPVYAQFESSVGKEFLDFARKELGSA